MSGIDVAGKNVEVGDHILVSDCTSAAFGYIGQVWDIKSSISYGTHVFHVTFADKQQWSGEYLGHCLIKVQNPPFGSVVKAPDPNNIAEKIRELINSEPRSPSQAQLVELLKREI